LKVIDLTDLSNIPKNIPKVKLKKESKLADLKKDIKEVFKKEIIREDYKKPKGIDTNETKGVFHPFNYAKLDDIS
jgi:hypothetical protein